MRKVNVTKTICSIDHDTKIVSYDRVFDFTGYFHQWGTAHIEYEAGPGNYVIAIIEKEDGTIVTVDVADVQFHKEESQLKLGSMEAGVHETPSGFIILLTTDRADYRIMTDKDYNIITDEFRPKNQSSWFHRKAT